MRIAIVTGGFAGIQAQHRAWKLQDEVAKMEATIIRHEQELEAQRRKLGRMRIEAQQKAEEARSHHAR